MNPIEMLFADADYSRDDELELESWELDDDDDADDDGDAVELSLDEWLESLS